VSPWGILIYATVCLWLAPGALFRPTALILLLGWTVAEVWYEATGDSIPMKIYLPFDFMTLAVVDLYRSHWSDWLIVPLIFVQWHWYGQPNPWIWLYWTAWLQFVIAGPWPQMQRLRGSVSHGPRRQETANEGSS
jgi:hypothetical protein